MRKWMLAVIAIGSLTSVACAARPMGPSDEAWLVKQAANFAAKYDAAGNGMAQGAVRVARAHALCQDKGPIKMARGTVKKWTGTVQTLDSVDDGRGVLAIRIAPHVTVATTNNALSESIADYKTLIPTNSAVYKVATGLRTGEAVVFSGQFFPSKTDCLIEQSLTVGGGMDDPTFLFRFTALQATN